MYNRQQIVFVFRHHADYWSCHQNKFLYVPCGLGKPQGVPIVWFGDELGGTELEIHPQRKLILTNGEIA